MQPRPPCPVWSVVSYGKQLLSATSTWETIKHIQHWKDQCNFFFQWWFNCLNNCFPAIFLGSTLIFKFIFLLLASWTSEYFNLVVKETTLASLDLISCHKSLQAGNPLQEHLWYVILHRLQCIFSPLFCVSSDTFLPLRGTSISVCP